MLTSRLFPLLTLTALTLAFSACQTTHSKLTPAEVALAIPDDKQALESIASSNAALQRAFLALKDSGNWKSLGYFSAQESDRTELLLFRFHAAHAHLNAIAERYRGMSDKNPQAAEGAALETKAHLLALEQSHFLVSTFAGDKIAIDKLNQPYPRSEIPRDTYDRLSESLEPPAKRKAESAELKIHNELTHAAYVAQAKLFYRVSRLKTSPTHLVHFSTAQKQELQSLLQPGDILLTFTAGYASDVFIPGAFKHGITYIGTVEQREAAGLSPDRIILVGGNSEGDKIAKDLRLTTTIHGRPANLIEAIAEGVKLSNLDHILDTHINRLLVLRPKIGPEHRAKQTSRTFSYLGQSYDFKFDFEDSSRQVCTEVIYRSLNGLNGINFPLTKRGGHETLSADDLVNYWLHKNPDSFEFILYAEEAPNSPGRKALILTGDEGKERVKALLASGGKG